MIAWSLLFQAVLVDRFFSKGDKRRPEIKRIKVALCLKLLGPEWQSIIYQARQLDDLTAFFQFDNQGRLEMVTLESPEGIRQLTPQSRENLCEFAFLIHALPANNLKLVSSVRFEVTSVLTLYTTLDEHDFKPLKPMAPDSEEEESSFARKWRKFRRDPMLFFKDSRLGFFQNLERLWTRNKSEP